MERFKKIFTNIDFHLNAKDRTLTIVYGESQLTLKLTEDGRIRLVTNLVLENPSGKSTKQIN